jgi:nucleoside-diphosphate-sugar epimerase
VERTFADTAKLQRAIGWEPRVQLPEGLGRFVDWYRGWAAR